MRNWDKWRAEGAKMSEIADIMKRDRCSWTDAVERSRKVRTAAPACSPYGSFVPCAGGHTFQYSGAGGRCPDGILCQCGAMRAKWETCPTCGQDRLIAVPANTSSTGQEEAR